MAKIWTLECPCCGDDAAWGYPADMVYDGQPLACGCSGHVSVDSENEPFVNVWECDCGS